MNQHDKIIQDLQPISTKSSKRIWEGRNYGHTWPKLILTTRNKANQKGNKLILKMVSLKLLQNKAILHFTCSASFCQLTSLLPIQLTVNLKVSNILGLGWDFLWIFCTKCACFDGQSQLLILLLHLFPTSIPGRN